MGIVRFCGSASIEYFEFRRVDKGALRSIHRSMPGNILPGLSERGFAKTPVLRGLSHGYVSTFH